MRRYFYDDKVIVGETLGIQGDLFHHIFDVCRLQVGQHFELITPQGSAFLARVEIVEKKRAQVSIEEERQIPQIREPHIYLYVSFPKIPTFELIVEKSVEMGVKEIIPVLSDFSFVRTLSQFPEPKMPRWQKIILQATQQSGRGDLMKLGKPQKLSDVFQSASSEIEVLNVVAYEGESPLSLKAYLNSRRDHKIRRINLFVGSEGGFSDSEISQFKKLDFPPVTLGDQVLRVETACLTLVSSLKYEFDLLC